MCSGVAGTRCEQNFFIAESGFCSKKEQLSSLKMLVAADAVDAYSIAILSGATYAHIIAQSLLAWPLIFIVFSLPTINLFINLGFVSGAGPVLTFSRIAPIATGVGWALTWLVGERLFLQSLSAAQNFLYFLYSIRRRLDWAVECNHSSYNNDDCANFTLDNITVNPITHWPENNWPAQQFNRSYLLRMPYRYGVRGLSLSLNLTQWAPNAWYFGLPEEKFGFELSSLSLTFSHFLIWAALFTIVYKFVFGSNPGKFLAQFCYILPLGLFLILDAGLFVFGFNFSKSSEKEISATETENNPIEYFSDLHGFYRTSIVLMDYSSAFTGLILFASSRLRSSSLPMNAIAVLIGQMVSKAIIDLLNHHVKFPPILLYFLRAGCSGHLSEQQPAYVSYISTEATFSFDTAAVCFGTSAGGPIWALLYYSANLLYSCIGPMTIFLLFIYNVFLEQFPVLEHYGTQLLAAICAAFSLLGVLLTMPVSSIYLKLIYLCTNNDIYCWYNLDADVRLMLSSTETYTSLFRYLIGPTSPLYTLFLLTAVPALLAAKFASVFDLLMSGKDVTKHIQAGTEFLTSSEFINHSIGYFIMFGPIAVVVVFALFAFYRTAVVYKMPWGSMLDPTTDWHSNFSLRQNALPRPAPISHRIYSSITKMPFHTALFVILIFEIIYGVILLLLFFSNTIYALLTSTHDQSASNNYRSVMYITFATFHILALLELRWALKKWDHSSRLNLCIGNSTMEMAFLNGYMWSSAMNHTWGFQLVQFLVIFVNTSLRGTIIAVLIAIRWSMMEQSHPTHIRDATEIYDATGDLDNDVDHEDNTPIIYEMHQDVFT
uniref:Orphan sodium-and chloride-dependent neurotransmitter transporter NTT5 n=1 Tax=Syphacia muris TaxID=451379 RepID=A0A0N5AEG8_9BILA